MALSEVTGIFSRYFVVGFFLPAFVSLVAVRMTASPDFIPNVLAHRAEPRELLILAGGAVVAGLALSGSSYYITRLFEGYPLERVSGVRVLGRLYRAALALQRRRFNRLLSIRDDKERAQPERRRAAKELDRFFPHSAEALLPTRVGNALRAFERHSNVRWGLDGITIWPRIETLMSADERELHVDAKISFYVFINSAVGAVLVGVCLLVDQMVNADASRWQLVLYGIPFVLAYGLYRASIGPATDWGDFVRSSIDLHRLELYEKLGVRSPTSFSDERALADRVNKHLLYGHPLLGDELWRGTEEESAEETESTGFLAWLKGHLMTGA